MSYALISGHVEIAERKVEPEDLGDLSASAGILIGSAISLVIWQLLILALVWAIR